jgi:hypothetical protein
MYGGLGASSSASWCDPTDPLWCVLCGNCLDTSPPTIAAPNAPGVPAAGYQPGLLTSDPTAILNSIIDTSAAQDNAQIQRFFAGQNLLNTTTGTPNYTMLAVLGVGVIALLALVKH